MSWQLRLARALVLLVAPVALVLAPPVGRAAPGAAGGTIGSYRMPAPSLRESSRGVRVYLPASYDLPLSREQRYPVVYLLHGWPGSEGNWPGQGRAGETLDSMIATGRIPDLIAVFPRAHGIGLLGRSMYLNAYDGRSRMEDFIVHDVVAWVDSNFRTRPEPRCRGLIGLSEGGSAAVNLAFRHPDVFGACASHSGDFRLNHGMGEHKILGHEPGSMKLLEENSPVDYVARSVESIKGMLIYIDCGLSDGEELRQGRDFHQKLLQLGVPHTYNEFPGGHSWGYWKKHLHESLLAVTSRMW